MRASGLRDAPTLIGAKVNPEPDGMHREQRRDGRPAYGLRSARPCCGRAVSRSRAQQQAQPGQGRPRHPPPVPGATARPAERHRRRRDKDADRLGPSPLPRAGGIKERAGHAWTRCSSTARTATPASAERWLSVVSAGNSIVAVPREAGAAAIRPATRLMPPGWRRTGHGISQVGSRAGSWR